MSSTLFISDLHLQAEQPQIVSIFLRFLQQQARYADALYILGDLFEVWVGDDDLSPFNRQMMQALKETTESGLPVYFMRGNRDFLIGKAFAKATGITLLTDPTVIDLYGIPTLLMHGDSLCTFDEHYQKVRRYTSSPVCQWLALRLPLSWRRRAGIWLRGKSQKYQQQISDHIMDVNPATVSQFMQTHRVPRLIHGHTHRPAIHVLPTGQRIVLGAWHGKGNMLICESDQNCQLQSL